MKYETLIRRAFGSCGRSEDPLGLAEADYLTHFEEDPHPVIFGISYALKKIRNDNDPGNLDLAHAMSDLDQNLWQDSTIDNVIRIINEATDLFDQYNIR